MADAMAETLAKAMAVAKAIVTAMAKAVAKSMAKAMARMIRCARGSKQTAAGSLAADVGQSDLGATLCRRIPMVVS